MAKVRKIQDDFNHGGSVSGLIGELGWFATHAGAGTQTKGISKITLNTGAVSGNRSGMHLGSTISTTVISMCDIDYLSFTVSIPILWANSIIRVGLGTDLSAANWGSNALYWEYDSTVSPNWVYRSRSGGAFTTATGSGILAEVVGDKVNLGFERKRNNVWRGLIDSVNGGSFSHDAVGTNATTDMVVGVSVETQAVGAKNLEIDTFSMSYRNVNLNKFIK